jgi:hypothetical protein
MVGDTTWLDDALRAIDAHTQCATMPEPRDSRPGSQGAPGMPMRATATMQRGQFAESFVVEWPA